jgi:hypothetical protein
VNKIVAWLFGYSSYDTGLSQAAPLFLLEMLAHNGYFDLSFFAETRLFSRKIRHET